MEKRRVKQLTLGGLVAIWVIVLGLGVRSLYGYGNSDGKQGGFSLRWPQDSFIGVVGHDRASLVMFLHPECPCSRASLEELDRLIAKTAVKPEIYVVFVVPKGWSNERAKMGLWLRASRMTAVTPVLDREGVEAKRFGALTSGQLYAYTPDGDLAFSGGLTPSRGHQGDNPGKDALTKFLAVGKSGPAARWKVFGCALFEAKPMCDEAAHAGHAGHAGNTAPLAQAASAAKSSRAKSAKGML